MISLKEWAVVVRALENGEQTVILRKGGIMEITSGFKIESKKFLLFPTQEHQNQKHIRPEFHKYIHIETSKKEIDGFVRITSFAEVLAEIDLSSEKTIRLLAPFHIWSESYITERINWKPDNPMKAVFLKVYKIPELITLLKLEYQGCKSWININEEIPVGETVLSEAKIELKLKEFQRIIN